MKKLLALLVGLLILVGCKKDQQVKVYSKDFSVSLTVPSTYAVSMVGSSVPLTISINGFDADNQGEFQTVFSTQSSGTIRIDDKEIPQGTTYAYDYRLKKMSLDFVYVPSSDGDKTIEVEVRCNGVVRKATAQIKAVSPETSMSFTLPEEPLIPDTPVSVPLEILTNNENLSLTAVFVKGAGKVELDGKVIDSEAGVPARNGTLRLVCTFTSAGEQVIDFTLKGRYGEPKKATLTLSVGAPEWSLTVEKMNTSQHIDLNTDHSFIFRINDEAVGNEFSCKYRFLSGNADLSFGGVQVSPSRAFKVGAGSSIAIVTPKSVGKIEIEFVVTDKFGNEHKDTAVFYTLGAISLSVSPQTQNVLVGDESKVDITVSEENYNESFTLKFERLTSPNTYEALSSRTVSKGTHEFRYNPSTPGTYTFRVTAIDKHGQSTYQIFSMEARAQKIVVTAPKLEHIGDIHKPITFEVNVTEKSYNGRFWLSWDMDKSGSELKSVEQGREQEVAPRNYTEIKNGKNIFKFTPNYVGTYPLKMSLKDERDQVLEYREIKFTSQAKVEALATEGGRTEGSQKVSDGQNPHTIIATPNHGYDFIHWIKTDNPTDPISTSKRYSFIVTDNVSYTAVFRLKEFIVKVTSTAGGSAAIEGSTALYKSFQFGKSAAVVATPTAGYDFVGWYSGGQQVSTQTRYQFVVSDNTNLEARFARQKMTLNVSSTDGGTVRYSATIQKSHNATLPYDTNVSLEARADATHSFAGWYEDNRFVSPSAGYSFQIKKHTNLEARFEILESVVVARVFPRTEAGTVSYNSSTRRYKHGQNIVVTITPNEAHKDGYTFVGWRDQSGKILSRSQTYSFVAQQQIYQIEAVFEPKQYEIYIESNQGYSATFEEMGIARLVPQNKIASYGEEIIIETSTPPNDYAYLTYLFSGSTTITTGEKIGQGKWRLKAICRGNPRIDIVKIPSYHPEYSKWRY